MVLSAKPCVCHSPKPLPMSDTLLPPAPRALPTHWAPAWVPQVPITAGTTLVKLPCLSTPSRLSVSPFHPEFSPLRTGNVAT